MKRRVYITGSKGQISLELRNYLSEKDIKVIILSRSKPKLFKNESHIFFDFTNTFHVERGYRNEVFHLAHDFTDKRIDNLNINYIGAKNLLKSFKNQTNKRFFFFSTLDLNEPFGEFGELKTKYRVCLMSFILVSTKVEYGIKVKKKAECYSQK